MPKRYEVHVAWDDEAKVWYVVQSNVPGLFAEAATYDELLAEIRWLAPELVKANTRPKERAVKLPQTLNVRTADYTLAIAS